MNKLDVPSQIHIEPTFGCPSQCWFCYKQVLTKNPMQYSFMSTETFENIIKQIVKAQWNSTIIKFALRGEPTLNPHLKMFFKIMNDYKLENTRAIITNGGYLNIPLVKSLFDLGLNYLMVDCYDNEKKIEEKLYSAKGMPDIIDYYKDGFNLHENINSKEKKIILIGNIEDYAGLRSERCFNNHAGNIIEENFEEHKIPLKKLPLNEKCNRPFREFAILHDGSVVQCCEDGNKESALGNVNNSDLYEIWHLNQNLENIRHKLRRKDRKSLSLCRKCDYNGS